MGLYLTLNELEMGLVTILDLTVDYTVHERVVPSMLAVVLIATVVFLIVFVIG
jgi:hypothetical protein